MKNKTFASGSYQLGGTHGPLVTHTFTLVLEGGVPTAATLNNKVVHLSVIPPEAVARALKGSGA